MRGDLHFVITDSGLGGLSICAGVERNLRQAGPSRPTRLTYVNAWPEEGGGYNVLPDQASRALVFDGALVAMDRLGPDRILIACNTLSIVYPLTAHSRAAAIPVQGIVDAGVTLFHEALTQEPDSGLVVLGTRTTIDSGVHRDRLIALGVDPRRIASIPCHGLAGAIETNPRGAVAASLIEQYASAVWSLDLPGKTLYAGLACTHYGYVAKFLCSALERHAGKSVRALDPNQRLVGLVAPEANGRSETGGGGTIVVEVVSKVRLSDETRREIGSLIESVSPATARALQSYLHVPDLF
jgi:glutamate racemase